MPLVVKTHLFRSNVCMKRDASFASRPRVAAACSSSVLYSWLTHIASCNIYPGRGACYNGRRGPERLAVVAECPQRTVMGCTDLSLRWRNVVSGRLGRTSHQVRYSHADFHRHWLLSQGCCAALGLLPNFRLDSACPCWTSCLVPLCPLGSAPCHQGLSPASLIAAPVRSR